MLFASKGWEQAPDDAQESEGKGWHRVVVEAVERRPSKLKGSADVPTTPATVSPADDPRPPGVPMHATDVAVVQLVVLQSASARTAVTVASTVPKFMPASETLARAERELEGDNEMSTGPACARGGEGGGGMAGRR